MFDGNWFSGGPPFNPMAHLAPLQDALERVLSRFVLWVLRENNNNNNNNNNNSNNNNNNSNNNNNKPNQTKANQSEPTKYQQRLQQW